MNPIFAVKLLYCLTYLSQNLLASFSGKFRIALDESKESALEIGIHQHIVFVVAISVHSKPTGILKFRSKALGQFI